MATNELYLPSYEELTVPELNITAPVFRAAAHHLGKYCDNQSKEFMLCRKEEQDPRACIEEGKQLTGCGFEFFGLLKKHCREDFRNYWRCIDCSDSTMSLRNCRPEQKAYDLCVLDHLKQERPPLGYFSMVRLHDSKRPQPHERTGPLPPPADQIPPDWYTRPDDPSIKLGARGLFSK